MRVRELPVIQNWDCHGCGECCRTYHVRVTDAEKARIEATDWSADPALKGVPPIVWDKALGCHRLNHTADGACVFLGEGNRCKIHAAHGPAAKPMSCRIYPFALVSAGDHWRVGLRYACPSAADNKGRPLAEHDAAANEYAALLEADAGPGVKNTPAPPLQPGQSVTWPDVMRFVKAVAEEIADDSTPIEHRLRKVAALATLCKASRFDKVTGTRLREFLEVVSGAVADEVPLYPKDVPPPSWLGRMVFRQSVAIYARKDTGPTPGVARRGRFTRMWAAWRFARGTGRIPRLHGLMPETAFEAAEQSAAPLGPESEALLTRYYLVKVESLQFCGTPNFHRPFWAGLDSLLLTFPAVLWLSRVLTTPDRPRDAAVKLAVQIVDDNFGFNTLLGTGRQAWATELLADRGELAKLIAWYSR